MDHVYEPLDVTDDQRNNLIELAEALEHFAWLKKEHNVQAFNMRSYRTTHACGSVVCAVGFGHAIGLGNPVTLDDGETVAWAAYARSTFGCGLGFRSRAFDWMFGTEWAVADNSPLGAAKRILIALAAGVPTDSVELRIDAERTGTDPDYDSMLKEIADATD